jgi:hypothetical protein
MEYLRAGDIISGQEAKAYLRLNGENQLMFYAKKLTATAVKEKLGVKTLGKRGTQYKTNGWSGSGEMTIYYATSAFRKLMCDYMKNGVDTTFDIQVINEDPASTIGAQDVTLTGCNLNSVLMTAFDVDSDSLSETVQFTFEGVTLAESFGMPELGDV